MRYHRGMILALACLVLGTGGLEVDRDEPAPARYVRIELPGPKRILSLAEVQVFSAGRSVGQAGKAKQSSVASGGDPQRAIDGDTNGVFPDGSVTHTSSERGAWWEVDLGQEVLIDRVVVWNRTDCCTERLRGFTFKLLDRRRRVLWERERIRESRMTEIVPFRELPPEPVISGPTPEERRAFQPRIDNAIDTGIEFLLTMQMWDGSFRFYTDIYPAGSTGLALYTLLKCKVPRDHPAVRRAAAFLLENPPRQTYELATVLMALGSLGDPSHRDFMEELLDQLLEFQGARSVDGEDDALWTYPYHGEIADLSNTQYAALGLRAAHRAGLRVPPRVWTSMTKGVLRYQEEPWEVEPVITDRRSTSSITRIAGFPYRVGGVATSSMTTAGLGILGVCKEALGDFPAGQRRKVFNARRQALAWLAHNFTVEANVGGNEHWLYYYIYGLERVGALWDIDHIGPHDWYWEGAKLLISRQVGDGSWSTQAGLDSNWASSESDTCFALLFLARATAGPDTGVEAAGVDTEQVWISEDPRIDTQWRITGGNPSVFFISGFSDPVHAECAIGQGSARGLRVVNVDYLVDGEVIATIPGDESRKWSGERFAARHEFKGNGTYRCAVRVTIRVPGEVEGVGETAELDSETLVVEVEGGLDERLLEYPAHASENLLRNSQVLATASTTNSDGQAAAKAVDGLLGTGWMCSMGDPQPRLTLELARAQRGRVLLISQVNVDERSRGAHDRATRLRVVLNGRKSLTFDLEGPGTDEEKCILELDRALSLRRLEITILERVPGNKWPGHIGISEVEWLARR